MKQYNGEKYIVSFTSFGERFNSAVQMLSTLAWQYYRDFHIVMTVYKDDVKDIPASLQSLIDHNVLELIVADENLCPHLKYFYAMKKYWDKPIITVDDDRLYSQNTLLMLTRKYETLNYKSIISNCATEMSATNGKLDPRDKWCVGPRRLLPNIKSYAAMAEGFAGVLYPPCCFDKLEDEVQNIKQCLYDDDLFLKVLELKQDLPVTQSSAIYEAICQTGVIGIDIVEAQNFSLAKHHDATMAYRKNVTELFEQDLLKAFDFPVESYKRMLKDLQ